MKTHNNQNSKIKKLSNENLHMPEDMPVTLVFLYYSMSNLIIMFLIK